MTKSKPHQERAVFRSGRTPEFYRKFIAGFPSSGMPLSDYCRMHHVGQNSFRKYREAKALTLLQASTIHPVPKLVRIAPKVEPITSPSPIEIILPGGVIIRLAELNERVFLTLRPILCPSLAQ
jgi:hypothetical protein